MVALTVSTYDTNFTLLTNSNALNKTLCVDPTDPDIFQISTVRTWFQISLFRYIYDLL